MTHDYVDKQEYLPVFFYVVESLMEFGMLHLQTFSEVGSCLVECLEFRLLFGQCGS